MRFLEVNLVKALIWPSHTWDYFAVLLRNDLLKKDSLSLKCNTT